MEKHIIKSAVVFFIIFLSLGYMGGLYREYRNKEYIERLIEENKKHQEKSMNELAQKIRILSVNSNDQVSPGN